ncbi:MAG: hypothetical protein HKN41_09545, partial [Ilumatobacter sp.]|nr:hypothetical protein [Ilumatobacter sp.]
MSRRRSSAALAAVAVVVLSACGASAPPARELANEMVDTLEVSDPVKECMHREIDEFRLTEEQAAGFSDFDDVAAKAAEGNELALQILGDFQSALASCR